MKKVRITATTYGLHINGRIQPKNRKSDPFFLEDEEANRLVSLGVAEIIGEGVATHGNGQETVDASENTPKQKSRAEDAEIAPNGDGEIPYKKRPLYNGNTKTDKLREIGRTIGLSFPPGTPKTKMTQQLDAFFNDYFGGAPELNALEPLI